MESSGNVGKIILTMHLEDSPFSPYSRKASRCEVSLPLYTKKCRFIVSWHFSAYLD